MARQDRATLANKRFYEDENLEYVGAAPHLKHGTLRALHDHLIADVYRMVSTDSAVPAALDLGAGEGTSSEALLELGARVTAVDLSERQLQSLKQRCAGVDAPLEVVCEDAWKVLDRDATFDVIVLNSFLHHVPDYLGLIKKAIGRLTPGGVLFSFQDPLRYDTVAKTTYVFSNASYFSWRVFQGDLLRGLKTRVRRLRGVYISGNEADDAEYHVTRNGVDQDAIADLLESSGFAVKIVRYFSTQSAVLQRIGALARLANTFGIVAQRR
jgi:SAM-dependent methyltransferase